MVTAIYGVEYLNCPDCTVAIEGANTATIGTATAGHIGHDSGSACYIFKDRQEFESHRVAVFEGRNRYYKPIPFVDFKTSDGRVFKDLQEALDWDSEKLVLVKNTALTPIPTDAPPMHPDTTLIDMTYADTLQNAADVEKFSAGNNPIFSGSTESPTPLDSDIPPNFVVETIHTRIADYVRENKATRAAGIAEGLELSVDEVEAAIADEKSLVVKGTAAWIKLKE